MSGYIDVVFDGPPSHKSGRFVEVEDSDGKSIDAGEWIDRGNGLWALRIPSDTHLASENERLFKYEMFVDAHNLVDDFFDYLDFISPSKEADHD